jgi:predicted ester cyclase
LYALLIILLLATTACQPVQPVSAMKADTARQENQAIVNRFYEEVINQKHSEVVQEVFDANIIDHELGYSIAGIGPAVSDKELFTALPDLHVKVNFWVIEGDLLTAMVTVSGTHTGGELAGVAPTDNPVTWSQIDIWHIKGGKVIEVWHNFGTADILQQIGYQFVPPAE